MSFSTSGAMSAVFPTACAQFRSTSSTTGAGKRCAANCLKVPG